MAEQIALLPVLSERLMYALVPASGARSGDRVTTSQAEAPLPARMSALTLVAEGTDDARLVFVPTVRVWATVERVPAAAADTMQSVPIWHRELVYDANGHMALTPVDDQVGVLPVHEWLRTWSEEWRTRLGGEPATNPLGPDARDVLERRSYEPAPDWMVRDDPLAEEWRERFGVCAWTSAIRRDHDYLATWLGHACTTHPHIAEFAISLRSLSGAIRAALGDIDDLEYLGRCPADITVGGTVTACGAGLWHDPYASVIICPRCHTETEPAGRIWLARRILDVWPIDRRRRYTRALIDALRPISCVTCHRRVSVEWIDATERADCEPFWRPGSIACPNACEMVESMAQSRAQQESPR